MNFIMLQNGALINTRCIETISLVDKHTYYNYNKEFIEGWRFIIISSSGREYYFEYETRDRAEDNRIRILKEIREWE